MKVLKYHFFPDITIIAFMEEKEFRKFLKDNRIDYNGDYPKMGGRFAYFECKEGDLMCLCFDKKLLKKTQSYSSIAGIVAHECLHCLKRICLILNEGEVSDTEFHTYFLQYLVVQIMELIEKGK